MRNGRKTSEFWLTAAFNIFGGLAAMGVLPINVDPNALITGMGIVTGAYTGSRAVTKMKNGG